MVRRNASRHSALSYGHAEKLEEQLRAEVKGLLARADAAVDTDTMRVVATGVTQATNDKQHLVPMLKTIAELPGDLGSVRELLADAGYFSEANTDACVQACIEPLLAPGRESHHLPWQERFTEPATLDEPGDAVEQMKHRLKTRAGRARYRLRKQTVEPVFGIIKAVMGFRQFLLRGLEAVSAEWSMVTMAWNIRRMAVLRG